jgi:predicted nucleotidyltransferase component of viral defense system
VVPRNTRTLPLREHLAFKGGTALRRCYFANYRSSEDLDFTLLQAREFPAIQASLEEIFASLRAASGIEFRLDHLDDVHENSHTFYLAYQGPLPAPDKVKVDITISERIVLPLENGTVLQSYAEFSDLPANREVRAYSLGEILTEKIVALSDRARTEPRDLYDAWHLANGGIAISDLTDGIQAKLEFRGRPAEGVEEQILGKEARLHRLWEQRLSHQISELPEFDRVFREFRRHLRRANLG